MPSKLVKITNNWHKEHKEKLHGKEYVIPAGASIDIPRYEGVNLMGSCLGYEKWDGDPKEYPYAKALTMTDLPESGEMNAKEFVNVKTGEKFGSQEALDKSLSRESDTNLVRELLEGLRGQATTGSKTYACPRCEFETPNKSGFLKHFASHEHISSSAA